jgi:16S rRNA (guanine527-N7)-methyltransferase
MVALDAAQIQQLEAHFDRLRRWNRTLNLTAVRDETEAIERHYAESLFFAHVLGSWFHEGQRVTVADVGSGAGFPGFVLAVLHPGWTVTLIESHQRKAVFLAEVARDLGNVQVVAGRAEQVERCFDVAVSRAVRPDDVLDLIPKLAPAAAFLVSATQAEDLSKSGMRWDVAVPLPWAPSRVVLIGVPSESPAATNL